MDYKWVIMQKQIAILDIIDMNNLCYKKELEHITGVDASDLVAKKIFCCFENWSL